MFALMHSTRLESLYLSVDPVTGLKAIIAIHNSRLGPALGGCRYLAYPNDETAVADAARFYKIAPARIIVMHDELDFLAEAGQRFVGRVVDHLLQDVQGIVGARIHAGALLDGLQPLENADRAFGIFAGGGRGRFSCHGGGL